MAQSKLIKRLKIKKRIRKHIFGTAEKPRLTVFKSNKQIYAQMVDDQKGQTLVAASSDEKPVSEQGNKTERATSVGQWLAEKAIKKGINACVFDRNGYIYHGRVKALAEGAREKGLKF